jgi:hypothetical protein
MSEIVLLLLAAMLVISLPISIWVLFVNPNSGVVALMPGGITRLRRANATHLLASIWPLFGLLVFALLGFDFPDNATFGALGIGFFSSILLARLTSLGPLWKDAQNARNEFDRIKRREAYNSRR